MIGIVGSAGDLGSQLLNRMQERGIEVATFDAWGSNNSHKSVGDVVADSEITHWCAPLDALNLLGSPAERRQLVLHSSVMHLSYDALVNHGQRLPKVGFNIVHCLMNRHDTVNAATGHVSEAVKTHLGQIGLNVRPKTIHEHDKNAALTQGAAMVLCELLLGELQGVHEEDLTPSGEWLLKVLEERAMNWTDATKNSVLRNPELSQLFASKRIEEIFQRYLNVA
ncbi:hypothetical protein IPP75_00860 [Candidatus Saccharibacteria bacterium]|nr:MAG: hypothetical protein IPP75_00860 [Candidatus Saccharibacteria bacterium]